MGIKEIIVKRRCLKCLNFHYKKTFKFVDESKIQQNLLNLEWHLFKIENGYYDEIDNFCKYSFRRD